MSEGELLKSWDEKTRALSLPSIYLSLCPLSLPNSLFPLSSTLFLSLARFLRRVFSRCVCVCCICFFAVVVVSEGTPGPHEKGKEMPMNSICIEHINNCPLTSFCVAMLV